MKKNYSRQFYLWYQLHDPIEPVPYFAAVICLESEEICWSQLADHYRLQKEGKKRCEIKMIHVNLISYKTAQLSRERNFCVFEAEALWAYGHRHNVNCY